MKTKKFSTDESKKTRSGNPKRIISILEKETSKKRSEIEDTWTEIMKKITNKWSCLLSEGIKGRMVLLKLPVFIS